MNNIKTKITMKTSSLMLTGIALMVSVAMMAQETKLTVTYEEVETVSGELYQYSARYLGTTDVITTNGTTYRLLSITPVPPMPPRGDKNCPQDGKAAPRPKPQNNKEQVRIAPQLPLSEETLLAASTAKKAESVAKQIYRIRETRMNILSGDVEHAPADGQAMRLVLDELRKQEQALTAMFVGKTITRRHTTTITLKDLDKTVQDSVMMRFSRYAGLVDSSDLSGEPVFITVTNRTREVMAPEQPKNKKEPRIYETVPYQRDILIRYDNTTLYETTVNL